MSVKIVNSALIAVLLFSHQAEALESHAVSEDSQLQSEQGSVNPVVADTQEVCVCSCNAYLTSRGSLEIEEIDRSTFPVKSAPSFCS